MKKAKAGKLISNFEPVLLLEKQISFQARISVKRVCVEWREAMKTQNVDDKNDKKGKICRKRKKKVLCILTILNSEVKYRT